MAFSYEDIFIAMRKKDVDCIAKMFDEAELSSKGGLSTENREMAAAVLGIASALVRWSYNAHAPMVQEIIQRTAASIDLYPFLWMVTIEEGITVGNLGEISDEVNVALRQNKYSEKFDHEIEHLSRSAFLAVINLLSLGKIRELDVRFNKPIICEIYRRRLISESLLFAYMGICLGKTAEEKILERFDDYQVALGTHDRATTLATILEIIESHEDDGK